MGDQKGHKDDLRSRWAIKGDIRMISVGNQIKGCVIRSRPAYVTMRVVYYSEDTTGHNETSLRITSGKDHSRSQ